MHFFKILVLTTSLVLLPVVGFAQSSPVLQIIQEQLILDKTIIKNASFVEEKDGTFGGLQVEIKSSASKDFIQFTKSGIGKFMNLVLNNKIVSSAKVQSSLPTRFLITGITKEDAQSFIDSLKK